MQIKLLYQGSIFLVFFTFIQCQTQTQNIEIKKKEFVQTGYNILENGRIISKPVSYLIYIYVFLIFLKVAQSIPVDQVQPSELQKDDIDRSKPKYIAHGDILIPIEEIEHLNAKR